MPLSPSRCINRTGKLNAGGNPALQLGEVEGEGESRNTPTTRHFLLMLWTPEPDKSLGLDTDLTTVSTTKLLSPYDTVLSSFPAYMKNMFSLRSSCYNLRGNNILSLCKPRTTSFGLHSFSYFAAKQWNELPDCIRTSDFTEFKRSIQRMTFV